MTVGSHRANELANQILTDIAAQHALSVEAVGPHTTMGSLLDLWIEDRSGQVSTQTLRIYLDTVRWLAPIIGGITVGEMTPARVKKALRKIEQDRSSAPAHSARVALNGAFRIAVELDVVQYNPVGSLRRMKPQRQMPKALNPHQVAILRELIKEREEDSGRHGGESGARILRWLVELMLGSGLRVNEVLALRNMDVEVAGTSGVISVTGTMIEDDRWVLVRHDELKSREHAGSFTLPAYARAVILEARSAQQDIVGRLPLAPALPGRRGTVISARSVRRALRTRSDALKGS